MKNRWVLTTKYRIDDIVKCEKARLVVKGFTQVCGADYDETYSPVSSYVMLRIFLSIVAVLDLNLMQLDMKNDFLQSKLDMVLYMALDSVLLGAGWKKSHIDEALYFKASVDGVTCWVLVYDDDLLAATSSPTMLKELKDLLEAAFELCEILPLVKYLGLEIVRDMPTRKLWLHQQGYADKLPDIAFACSKLGSGLTVRSDQHWREVDHCLAYLADTRDTALEFGSGPGSLELIGYVDADDTCDKQNRTSTGGYVSIYRGAAVSWRLADAVKVVADTIDAVALGKEDWYLLLVDFKKAYKSVPRNFLFYTLERMGFPEAFVKWSRGLHEQAATQLLTNGWLGEKVEVGSGPAPGPVPSPTHGPVPSPAPGPVPSPAPGPVPSSRPATSLARARPRSTSSAPPRTCPVDPSPLAMDPRDLSPLAAAPVPCRIME
ncbi:unnamed protein product, partial [Closterium sp. NIES-53]